MVKKSFIRVMFAAAALSLGSCATNSDIDDLKGELDDLRGDLTRLEEAQKADLLAQITLLENQIAALQAELDGTQADMAAEYDALLADLTDLQNEVASGDKVFYGSVLTADDFASFVADEETIVTGDVVITSQDQVAQLAKLEVVGGNLIVKGGSAIDLAMLQSVSGNVIISGVNEESTLSFPMLKAVGLGMEVMNTVGLSSVNMPELLLVNGNLEISDNDGLMTVTFGKLDMVAGDLHFNAYWENDPNYLFQGATTVDFAGASVMGDATFEYLGMGTEVMLGNVSGDLTLMGTGTSKLGMTAEKMMGSIIIEGNAEISELDFPNLTEVMGSIRIANNKDQSWGFGWKESKLEDLSAFDNVTMIGGDVYVAFNNFSALDAFNSVETLGGYTSPAEPSIYFYGNGGVLTYVNIFNALTGVSNGWDRINVTISEKTDWFNGFEVITELGVVDYHQQLTQDAQWNQGTVAKFDGFDALTSIRANSRMAVGEVTEFNGFPVLESIDRVWMGDPYYFTLEVPADNTVSLCNLSTLINNIKANEYPYSDGTAYFADPSQWPSDVDVDFVIDNYMVDCAN